MKKELIDSCIKETKDHKRFVQYYIDKIRLELKLRADIHDDSKLEYPELEIFAEYTPKLKNSTYGSEEYNQFLKEMKVALDHHYANNSHHPDGFENGIRDMDLIDIVEMLCDWKSATLRHADGDIRKSIEINQKRFNMSDDLTQILLNTVDNLFWWGKVK